MVGKKIKFLFKLSVSLILLGVILWMMGGVKGVLHTLAKTDPLYIVIAFIVSTLDRVIMTFKWTWLLRTKRIHLPLFQGMKIYCASMIWGMVMPSTVGADAIRVFSTSRKGHDVKEVLVSIVIERMIGFLSALLLGMIGLIVISRQADIGPRATLIFWLTGAMIGLAIIGFIFSLSQMSFDIIHNRLFAKFRDTKVMKKIREFHVSYQDYKSHKATLVGFFGMTFGEQLMPILFNWVIAIGLGVEVGFLYMLGAFTLSILIARLPISIDGLGVYDGAFILFLSLAGFTAAQAVSIAFAGRIIQTASWLPWWLAHVIGNRSILPPSAAKPIAAEEV